MKKVSVLMMMLSVMTSLPAFADRQERDGYKPDQDRQEVECRIFIEGWQVFSTRTGRPLGEDYFGQRSGCQNAIDASRHGFVCAAENGGAIVADIRTGRQVGEGYYGSLSSCNNAVAGASRGLICGAQKGHCQRAVPFFYFVEFLARTRRIATV